MKLGSLSFVPIALSLLACDASFTDLRPAPLAAEVDAGFFDAGFDDAGQPIMIEERRLAAGTFAGRGRYTGQGSAELLRASNGAIELRFGSDFRTSSVPGPVVVLTTRDRIGPRIDPAAGDLELGTLRASSGAQTYATSEAGSRARFAWVYCKPFGVEIARAELSEVP